MGASVGAAFATVLFLLLLFSAAGCTAQTEVQKKFGADADYFIGLKLLQEDNEKGFEFEGKHYSMYEGTQLQRGIEREIRKQKVL